ncbi:hypothetical protein EPO66_04080 [bacterium]|nr:MAG: hypothetical protein EPO66_04080 [bacterium]
MAEANLKDQLSTLIQLQDVDRQIYLLKEEKEAGPKEIEALKLSFEAKKQKLAELEKSLLDAQKQRKDKELELGTKEEGIKKLQSQLFQLKTNKEYHAMLTQIQDSKADNSVIEDKILELFESADKIKVEVDAEKQRLLGEEKAFNEDKKRVDEKIKEIESKLVQLEAQRNQIIPKIDKKVLGQYDRILSNRDGLAIVSVRDNTCKGCNMHVPPQVINLIRMYERIITCEVCNRILYVENENA